MKIIVLQHIPIEDPGYIKTLLAQDKCELTTIELDRGEKIPDNLQQFDAMLCMGGPMDTWMTDDYPWLSDEKKRIKEFVCTLEKPFLGFCLGAQLLGEVLGGSVVKSNPSEIGVLDIKFNQNSNNDLLFSDFEQTIKAVQWHSYEVKGLEENPNVTVLASSATTKYQIFRYRQNAYGIQFHIEVEKHTIKQWAQVAEYKNALIANLGQNAIFDFDKLVKINMNNMNANCKILYKKFKKLIHI